MGLDVFGWATSCIWRRHSKISARTVPKIISWSSLFDFLEHFFLMCRWREQPTCHLRRGYDDFIFKIYVVSDYIIFQCCQYYSQQLILAWVGFYSQNGFLQIKNSAVGTQAVMFFNKFVTIIALYVAFKSSDY